MKNLMKAMIVLGVILLSLGMITGCEEKEESKEVENDENSISGKYYNKDDPGEYIDLKNDRTVFWRHKTNPTLVMLGQGEYTEDALKWKVDGDEIALIGPLGGVERAQIINENTIFVDDKFWTRQGEIKKPIKKISKHNIPGKYVLQGVLDGERQDDIPCVFEKDGAVYYEDGETVFFIWKVENGFVQLYVDDDRVFSNGRVEGDDILFEGFVRGKSSIIRFIKQDGKAGATREEPQTMSERKETGGIASISDGEMRWVKCNNPACEADYEMGLKTYYKELQENMNPNPMDTSPTVLTCNKCNKRSLYGAIKCANADCGIVFIEGISGPDDYADRCPDCGKSETQESRKRRLRGTADLPRPRHYVEDYANVIDGAHERSLNTILQALEQKTGAQYIVLTVQTTAGLPIDQFSIELANEWKLGQKGKDNGMLFVLAKQDRKYRFEVGYGLEDLITTQYLDRIGKEVLVPYLKQASYSRGVYEANVTIAQKINGQQGVSLIKTPVGDADNQTLDRSKLSQQINKRRGLFADSSAFPKPPVSLGLRASASSLVERVETIHFAALDYQFLSLKSLRYASTCLKEGDLARAKYYIETADRHYKVAVALQRDSQSVLDGTYSAAETATKGVKDACQTATTLGLKVINPVAGKVVDYIYVGIDYALDRAIVGNDEAAKNAVTRLLVKALFEEVKFPELGNRTIASYIGDSIGKEVFPLLDKVLRSEEAKLAVLEIIKESGVKVSEQVLLRSFLGN